jgi:hypothetical protein
MFLTIRRHIFHITFNLWGIYHGHIGILLQLLSLESSFLQQSRLFLSYQVLKHVP